MYDYGSLRTDHCTGGKITPPPPARLVFLTLSKQYYVVHDVSLFFCKFYWRVYFPFFQINIAPPPPPTPTPKQVYIVLPLIRTTCNNQLCCLKRIQHVVHFPNLLIILDLLRQNKSVLFLFISNYKKIHVIIHPYFGFLTHIYIFINLSSIYKINHKSINIQ